MPISLTPWLTPEERFEVIERLVNYQLIKWDNGAKVCIEKRRADGYLHQPS
jgi:hypothetical protein